MDTINTIKWQQKILTSNNINTAASLTELNFDNLVIGKSYKISGTAAFSLVSGTSFTDCAGVIVGSHNGVIIFRITIRDDNEYDNGTSNSRRFKYSQEQIFVATTTTILFSSAPVRTAPDVVTLIGDGTTNNTFVTLEELTFHINTSIGAPIIPNVLGDDITEIKWQRKQLLTSIISTTTGTTSFTDMNFSNMTIGYTYRLTMNAYIQLAANSGATSDNEGELRAFHNNIQFLACQFRDDHEPNAQTRVTSYNNTIVFTATATTITFNFYAVVGGGSSAALSAFQPTRTYAILEYLPQHIEVIDF